MASSKGSREPTLPIPPPEMRRLVTGQGPDSFENPSGAPALPGFTFDQLDTVFDFGCGCGRLARKLLQQSVRPARYVGIDAHRGMIEWCKRNLTPLEPSFEFRHHDVWELGYNPGCETEWRPFPAADASFRAVAALSIFTHLLEPHARAYLREVRRILHPQGRALTTWFLFDKSAFPMMQEDQNALFINPVHPVNAVVFDRSWLLGALREAGLSIVAATPPEVRGFQWWIELACLDSGVATVPLPDDVAPLGIRRPPRRPERPDLIGLDDHQTLDR
jgi:SAM-dependent methyltransferase